MDETHRTLAQASRTQERETWSRAHLKLAPCPDCATAETARCLRGSRAWCCGWRCGTPPVAPTCTAPCAPPGSGLRSASTEGVRQTHTGAAALTPVREACAVPVAGAAPWRAALREPEDGLANRAGVGAVRAADLQRLDDSRSRSLFAVGPSRQLGVDGIARRRRDHGAMGGGRRDAGQDGSGAQGCHLLLERLPAHTPAPCAGSRRHCLLTCSGCDGSAAAF